MKGRVQDEYRAGGLAVVGASETFAALEIGQVNELLISASRAEIRLDEGAAASPLAQPLIARATASAAIGGEPRTVRLADEFVNRAQQTGARVTFIEDPALLAEVGGVGAKLRFLL